MAADQFVLGWCAACAREVLTHADVDADGTARRLCLICDGPVDEGLRQGQEADLAGMGYVLIDPSHTCGTSGCGSGNCGCG